MAARRPDDRRPPLVLSVLARAAAAVLLLGAALGTGDGDGEVLWLDDGERAAFEPTAAFDARGRLWVAWVSTDPGMRDTASAGRIDGICLEAEDVARRFAFEDSGPLPAAPRLAAFGDGVYCVWESGAGGERRLLGRALDLGEDGPRLGALETVPCGGVAPLAPDLASGPASGGGTLSLVFQGLAERDYDLYFATRAEDGWSEARPLLDTPEDEWCPRLAADRSGGLHLVWDAFDGADFDVHYARISAGGELAGRVAVAGGPDHDGLPELSVTGDGVAWIAWERAGQFGEVGGLRSEREVGLARVEDGAVTWLAPRALPRRELPRVLATSGGLLLAHRTPVRGEHKRDHLFTAWVTSVARFGGPRADERELEASDGGLDHDQVLVDGPDGPRLVFAADGRRARYDAVDRWADAIERRTRIGVVRLAPAAGFPETHGEPPPALRTTPPPAPAPLAAEDLGERPLWGDLHRHTDLSRCGGAKDGSLLDVWRYARGPGRLDFVAVTDHFQHLRSWSFWRTVRDSERYHAPGSLVVFAGIERVRAARGHYNDVYLDPAHVRWDPDRWSGPPSAEAPAPADEVISIPHMMSVDDGTGFDWDEFDEDRTRLFEVYQGKRGSYEGHGLPFEAGDGVEPATALARGFERGAHFGLIASSDHVSSRTSWAGVHAAERTRESIFEALRARRAFAATAPRAVDARLGELAMGEAGPVAPGASGTPFVLELPGASAQGVAYVELVANGETAGRLVGLPDGRERWVLTLRRGYLVPEGGLLVQVTGGRIVDASVRRPEAARIDRWDESTVVFARTDYVQSDLVLEIEWDPGGRQAISFPGGRAHVGVERASVAVGHSIAIDERDFGGALWRQGRPLGDVSGTLSFDVDARPGDSFYARVAWTDGNLAWTSPIRVRAAPEGAGE